MTHEDYMKRALALAEKGMGHTNPNPMVGAVIVKDGRIIGEGYHERCGEGHAEVNAFKHCTEDPRGADMYVTLEPCSHYGKTPPCADLIISKKIARVFVGADDPNPQVSGRGIKKLRDAGIEVVTHLMAEESIDLNEVFMKYIRNKEPFIVLKTAMSLDGKIATVSGESQWISSEGSRMHSQGLRARYMAILAGIGTVLADDPRLTCRLEGKRSPIRIIADSTLRIPENAKVLDEQDKAPTIIAVGDGCDKRKKERLCERGIRIIEVPGEDGRVDFEALFKKMGSLGIDSILAEGGGTVAGTLVAKGLADRVTAYIAPMLIGGKDAKTPVEGEGIERLETAMRLRDVECEMIDGDIMLTGRVDKPVK